MQTGLVALDATDWSKLHHAFGRATDTPDVLRSFWKNDREGHKNAVSYLWDVVIHQSTPWTATAPAALVVAGLVNDQRLEPDLRAKLLAFLVEVVEASSSPGHSVEELERLAHHDIDALIASDAEDAIYHDDASKNAFFARAVLGCASVTPTLMDSANVALGDADRRVRAAAADCAVALVKTESLSMHLKEVEAKLLVMARSAENDDERCAHILALGELGYPPLEFLTSSSRAVRVCAAMAPALAHDPDAINELVDAFNHHTASIDGWFVEQPPQFSLRPRLYVVRHTAERVTDFEQLATGAVALARTASDWEWGRLLPIAFPDGTGIVRTQSQRQFLSALVARPDIWNFQSAREWFVKAGLPSDREGCARRVKGASLS
ncbi:MAG TPA: hypothetical protein VGH49_08595 [Xanthobacteraceae bacterium]|jgi:hypothetical protein